MVRKTYFNGNVTSRNGFSVTWSSFNHPTVINGSGESVTFAYRQDHTRWSAIYNGSTGIETTYFIGDLLEKVISAGVNDYRHYIFAGGTKVAIYSRMSTGTNTVHYVREDHLGGVAGLVNSDGSSYVKEGFTAFGARRNSCTWSGPPTAGALQTINAVTRHGFTWQTALGAMGLNDMNGRIQDAVTGRFLSPDPTVSHPDFTQGFNRYSYVQNNPLTYIDPTGFDCYTPSSGLAGQWAPCGGSSGGGTPGFSSGNGTAPSQFPGLPPAAVQQAADQVLKTVAATATRPQGDEPSGLVTVTVCSGSRCPGYQGPVSRFFRGAVNLAFGWIDCAGGMCSGGQELWRLAQVPLLAAGGPALDAAKAATAAAEGAVAGAESAANVMNGVRLSEQLSLVSANSVLTAAGELSEGAIAGSREIIPAGSLGNPAIPEGFAKFATDTFASRSGPFQAHFYMNPTTGQVFYGLDYKVIFNLGF